MLLHPGFDEGPVDVLPVVVKLLVGDVWALFEEGDAAYGVLVVCGVGHGVVSGPRWANVGVYDCSAKFFSSGHYTATHFL